MPPLYDLLSHNTVHGMAERTGAQRAQYKTTVSSHAHAEGLLRA